MLLVGTNVLIAVLEDDPIWADWSVRQLRAQAQVHELTVNPVIYGELSLVFESVDALDDVIAKMSLLFQEIPRAALFLAGLAFVKYRRAGGNRSNVLADFFIGAHAAVAGCGILTGTPGDTRAISPGFPSLRRNQVRSHDLLALATGSGKISAQDRMMERMSRIADATENARRAMAKRAAEIDRLPARLLAEAFEP